MTPVGIILSYYTDLNPKTCMVMLNNLEQASKCLWGLNETHTA